MKPYFASLALFIFTMQSYSQHKQSLDVQIGLGLISPTENLDLFGTGFYLQGKYVYEVSKWIEIRPYAGVVLTKARQSDKVALKNFKVATNAFLLGGKVRLSIPIPWVAPYIELGIGGSLGKFQTITSKIQIDHGGATYHIPFTLGIKFGRNHETDLALSYFFHNNKQQFAGAYAIGFTISIRK